MRFTIEHRDELYNLTCDTCKVGVAATTAMPDQLLSDLANGHARVVHRAKQYSSVHVQVDHEKPGRRFATLTEFEAIPEEKQETAMGDLTPSEQQELVDTAQKIFDGDETDDEVDDELLDVLKETAKKPKKGK